MRSFLSAVLLLSAVAASAQTLESSYDEAVRLHGRVSSSGPKTCWTRAASEAADAAGMPLEVCVSYLKIEDKTVTIAGTLGVPGDTIRQALYEKKSMTTSAVAGGTRAWAFLYTKDAGKEESDQESVVQLEFRLDAAGAVVPDSMRLIAFHQCPERGCSYACGMTTVAFTLVPAPAVAPGPRTSY